MENKGAIQKGFGCVFWFLLAMSIFPTLIGGYYAWQEYQTLAWEKTTAKIVAGGYFHPKGNDTGRITVEYNIQGKTYRHFTPFIYSQASVLTNDLTTMRKYSFGSNIDLFYDPLEQPVAVDSAEKVYQRTRTALKQGLSDDFYMPFIFSGIFVFGAFGFRRLARGLISGVNRLEEKISELPKHEEVSISSQEIIYKDEIEALVEDRKGRVILDNTGRAGRIGVVLFFMVILALFYWGMIAWTGVTHKELQYYFAIPVVWGLVVAFAVSDTTIIKREGILKTRRGWLFFVRKRTYMLHTFKKVIITMRDLEKHSSHHRDINRRKTYNIQLEGKETVSIFVSGDRNDACQLAQQLAKHLKLDVEC